MIPPTIMIQGSSNKERYFNFCNSGKNVPLFLQPWWMNAVCKAKDWWEVFLYEENDEIKGVFICNIVKKTGLKMIIQPQLTQYNGIWLDYGNELSDNDKIHFEKKAIGNLLVQLNDFGFDYFNQNFPLNFVNWLPFYWQKFSQTTRYTYQLTGINNPEACFEKFSYAKKKQIRKAQKELTVSTKMSAEDFYVHLTAYQTSRRQKMIYSDSFFMNLYNSCKSKNQGEIIAVIDSKSVVHAALFIVWDNLTGYNLISTIHPDYKNSGASTLVVFEAIKYLSDKVQTFDFEGSMDAGIENSFSQFATVQSPYFSIKKYNSLTTRALFPIFKL